MAREHPSTWLCALQTLWPRTASSPQPFHLETIFGAGQLRQKISLWPERRPRCLIQLRRRACYLHSNRLEFVEAASFTQVVVASLRELSQHKRNTMRGEQKRKSIEIKNRVNATGYDETVFMHLQLSLVSARLRNQLTHDCARLLIKWPI